MESEYFSTMHKTLAELRMYARNETLVKGNDHFMDCMHYIVMLGLGLARSKAEEAVRRNPHLPPYYGEHGWMRL